MREEVRDTEPMEAPGSQLERSLIDEFLRARGHDARSIAALSEQARDELLEDASSYAALKLAEIEARARYVTELHGSNAIE